MHSIQVVVVVVVVLSSVPSGVEAKKRSHHYEIEDEVPFYVNKIGPYSNPSETYEFYSLPFCQPTSIQHKHTKIGEDLTGDHKVNSLYDLRFRGKLTNAIATNAQICSKRRPRKVLVHVVVHYRDLFGKQFL